MTDVQKLSWLQHHLNSTLSNIREYEARRIKYLRATVAMALFIVVAMMFFNEDLWFALLPFGLAMFAAYIVADTDKRRAGQLAESLVNALRYDGITVEWADNGLSVNVYWRENI